MGCPGKHSVLPCLPQSQGPRAGERPEAQRDQWDGTVSSDTLATTPMCDIPARESGPRRYKARRPGVMLPPRLSAPRVTFPGLRPPHPRPSMHQTTASALRGRKHSLLKIAARGAGLGRAGQGWPTRQGVQRPLRPPGSTQQSEVLSLQLHRATVMATPPGPRASPPCLPQASLSSHGALRSCHFLHPAH